MRVYVCVFLKYTHDSGVRNKVSYTFDSRNHLIKFFVGFFYLSLSATIKFYTEFWVDYRDVKTTTRVQKKKKEKLYSNV